MGFAEIGLDELMQVPFCPRGKGPGTLGNHEFIALYLLIQGPMTRYHEVRGALSRWRGKATSRSWGMSYFQGPNLHYPQKFRGICVTDDCYWWQPRIEYRTEKVRTRPSKWFPSGEPRPEPIYKRLKHSERGYRLTAKGLSLAAEATIKVLTRRAMLTKVEPNDG